jgi:hypothetical protein
MSADCTTKISSPRWSSWLFRRVDILVYYGFCGWYCDSEYWLEDLDLAAFVLCYCNSICVFHVSRSKFLSCFSLLEMEITDLNCPKTKGKSLEEIDILFAKGDLREELEAKILYQQENSGQEEQMEKV